MKKDAERDVQLAISLEKMSRSMIRLEDMMSIVIQDWQRKNEQLEEILSDIDIAMAEIKEYMNNKRNRWNVKDG